MDTDYGVAALADSDLYRNVVRHRSVFNHIDGVDYSSHSADRINFLPPAELIDDWRKDYDSLVKHFLYNNKENLSFEQLMARMRELLERVRRMDM